MVEDIRKYFERSALYQKQRQAPAIKREAHQVDVPDVGPVKRTRTSQPQLPVVPPIDLPLRLPLSTSSAKLPSERERLQWNVFEDERNRVAVMAKLEAARSEKSKDSVTDIVPSEELRDLWPKRKRSGGGL